MLRLAQIGWFAILITLAGCAGSLVYSPSLNLPGQPLKGGNVQLIGGITGLAETRPNAVQRDVRGGEEGLFRVGISDHVALQTKGWMEFLGENASARGGLSFSSIIALDDSARKIRVGIMPSIGFVFDGYGWQGGGGTIPCVLWLPHTEVLHPIAAVGPVLGIRNPDENQWGIGLIANGGLVLTLSPSIQMAGEAAWIYQANMLENVSNAMVVPSFSLQVML